MIAALNDKAFDLKVQRKPQIGDMLEMDLNSNPSCSLTNLDQENHEPYWIKMWPLRDKKELEDAIEIVKTNGQPIYSRPNFIRRFRIVSPIHAEPYRTISLEELKV